MSSTASSPCGVKRWSQLIRAPGAPPRGLKTGQSSHNLSLTDSHGTCLTLFWEYETVVLVIPGTGEHMWRWTCVHASPNACACIVQSAVWQPKMSVLSRCVYCGIRGHGIRFWFKCFEGVSKNAQSTLFQPFSKTLNQTNQPCQWVLG